MDLVSFIQSKTNTNKTAINNIIKMSSEGATIPFMVRYRKELTGSLDEVVLEAVIKSKLEFEEIQARKSSILDSIKDQGKLTPELEHQISSCFDLTALEDIYLPFKKRKKTKADIARDLGLEGLAKQIMAQKDMDISKLAIGYVADKVKDINVALSGARDIIAEWINESIKTREFVRSFVRRNGVLTSKVIGTKKEDAKNYQDYFDFSEHVQKVAPHRVHAILRGHNDGFLRISIKVDDDLIIHKIQNAYVKQANQSGNLVKEAIQDAYERLLYPSIENQVFNDLKEVADKEAIEVFSKNLRQLLTAPPLGAKSTLAIDPGFRTGCKVAVLSQNGSLLENTTIYPCPPQNDTKTAHFIITELIIKYKIQAIAIGNGTASRETEGFIRDTIKSLPQNVEIYVVSESGASIYSASPIAREEFPNLDATVRGAISIGRRLMDPLAELVKIDPKSIGVGQYQHDVNQVLLKASLDSAVISVVNHVGVDLNTASPHLLQYVSGLGLSLANKIVETRQANGHFNTKEDLKKIPRLGPKVFEQCAGFLRIRNGSNPLDNTGVHPEAYALVDKIAESQNTTANGLVGNIYALSKIKPSQYISEKFGLPTIEDIFKELQKPGHDPRGEAQVFTFDESIRSINDVKPGMVLNGIVGNMTNFGAFVDIGIKENGLIHISQITDKFIKNASEVLNIGQCVSTKVLEVDVPRKRISLTLKF